jgi:SAM-dependent methyltransferase
LDPHLHSLRAAQVVAKQLGLDVTFICGDARAMPFQNERFDVAFSYSVIQHFDRADARTTIAEVGRILRPGGMSFIQMPNVFALRSLYHLARRGFADGSSFDVRYWTRRSLKRVFGELVGSTSLSVDGFFGLGIQASDKELLPARYRAVIAASEMLRKATDFFPPLGAVADSQYVTSVKQPS